MNIKHSGRTINFYPTERSGIPVDKNNYELICVGDGKMTALQRAQRYKLEKTYNYVFA